MLLFQYLVLYTFNIGKAVYIYFMAGNPIYLQ